MRSLAVVIVLTITALARAAEDGPTVPVVTVRPDPKYTIVNITVPAIPGLVCEVWCYEDRFGRAVSHEMDGPTLVLAHRNKDVTATTRLVPEPGAVSMEVKVTGPREAVRRTRILNACVQFQRSSSFGVKDRNKYVEDFVARCFVFLEGGMTMLKDTKRIPGTRPGGNERANLPKPWIQEYYPTWRKHPGQIKGQRGFSTDRPVLPIIGVVSRDGGHLAAVAWPETMRLGQVWHCCIHPRPQISESFDEKTGETRSRGRLYFMPNDEAKLLAAFRRDFPGFRR